MSGPKITGPVARTNTFRLCLDADVGQGWNVTSNAAMQALPYPQEGDTCCVITSTGIVPWMAVATGKNSHGANCLAGQNGMDWLYQIDKIAGQTTLVNGHAAVYLPDIDIGSIPRVWYISITGNPGTLTAHMVTNGVSLDSTSGTDGSTVGYEVTI